MGAHWKRKKEKKKIVEARTRSCSGLKQRFKLKWCIQQLELGKGFTQFSVPLMEAPFRNGNPITPCTCARTHTHTNVHTHTMFLLCYWVSFGFCYYVLRWICGSESCGVSIAIALADMHECETEKELAVKRFRGVCGRQSVVTESQSQSQSHTIGDQPRSPFRFFM